VLLQGARRPPLSIDISCPHGAQQQTRRTPRLRSNDETDGRTDGRTLDRFIDPAPHTMRAVSSSPVGTEISSQNNDVVSSILSPFLAEQSGIRQSSLPRNPRLQNPQLSYHQTNLRANLYDEYSTLHSPSGCSTVSSSPVWAQQSGIQ